MTLKPELGLGILEVAAACSEGIGFPELSKSQNESS